MVIFASGNSFGLFDTGRRGSEGNTAAGREMESAIATSPPSVRRLSLALV
jgi:hypothetical protein